MSKLYTWADRWANDMKIVEKAHPESVRILVSEEDENTPPAARYSPYPDVKKVRWSFVVFNRVDPWSHPGFRDMTRMYINQKMEEQHAYLLDCRVRGSEIWYPAQTRDTWNTWNVLHDAGALIPPDDVVRSRRSADYKLQCAREMADRVSAWRNDYRWGFVLGVPGMDEYFEYPFSFVTMNSARTHAMQICEELQIPDISVDILPSTDALE